VSQEALTRSLKWGCAVSLEGRGRGRTTDKLRREGRALISLLRKVLWVE
jgi:hypothetical protein